MEPVPTSELLSNDVQTTSVTSTSARAKRTKTLFDTIGSSSDCYDDGVRDRSLSRMVVSLSDDFEDQGQGSDEGGVEGGDEDDEKNGPSCLQATSHCVTGLVHYYVEENTRLAKEIYTECLPPVSILSTEGLLKRVHKVVFTFIHVPYFPALHRPGWLLRYLVGPHNEELLEMFVSDFIAGLTVGLTLIPQGTCADLSLYSF